MEIASAAKIESLAALYSLVPKSISTSCIYVFGERRMNDHHTITENNVQGCGEVASLYMKIARLLHRSCSIQSEPKEIELRLHII